MKAAWQSGGFGYILLPKLVAFSEFRPTFEELMSSHILRTAAATAALHSQGHVYFDHKTANLLFDPISRKIYVMDLGTVREVSTTGRTPLSGTPGYVPVEDSLRSEPVVAKSAADLPEDNDNLLADSSTKPALGYTSTPFASDSSALGMSWIAAVIRADVLFPKTSIYEGATRNLRRQNAESRNTWFDSILAKGKNQVDLYKQIEERTTVTTVTTEELNPTLRDMYQSGVLEYIVEHMLRPKPEQRRGLPEVINDLKILWENWKSDPKKP